MDLTPRQLAFLEHEMEQIIEASDRTAEDKSHASSVLGRIQGDLEFKAEQNSDNTPSPEEIFG